MSVKSRRQWWRLWLLGLIASTVGATCPSLASALATTSARFPIGETSVTISGPARIDVGREASYLADVQDASVQPVAYSWTIGGREIGAAATLTYTFQTAGPTTLELRVVDSVGNTHNAGLVVDVIVAPQGPVDRDGDGYPQEADCNDANAAIHPQATEVPDNDVDEDCNGTDLRLDHDHDGFAPPFDCNDEDPAVHPGAREVRGNGIDEDCDGADARWPRMRGVRLAWAAHASRGHTTLERLALRGAPRNARVTVTCTGGGCPKQQIKVKATGRSVNLAIYTRRKLRPGARVTARVDYPPYISEVIVMTIRRSLTPMARNLCQAPGERRASTCS